MTRLSLVSSLSVLVGAVVLALVLSDLAGASGPMVTRIENEWKDNRATIRVVLNARLAPKLFPLDTKGKNPRVVIDFAGASAVKRIPSKILPKSPVIRSLRVGIHHGPKPKVRLVVDLVPGYLYQIDQWFRRDNNTFVLMVSPR